MAPIATLAVKLQAQIAEFQGEFREAQRDVQKFHDNFEATATKASAFGTLIARGLELGVSAFIDLGRKALESASKIEDMAQKTGLSIQTIQEFQHVARETGTSVDAFASAAFNLGTRLAGDNKSVKHAVAALGLEFEHLRTLKPDEQFDLIAEALGRMESPQERNRLGLELFGRRFQEIAPAIAEGYRKLADGADKMADDTVKRLADAQDAWEKLSNKIVIVSGEAIGWLIKLGEESRKAQLGLPGQPGSVEEFPDVQPPRAPGAPSLFRPTTPPTEGIDYADMAAKHKEHMRQLEEARKKSEEYAEALKRIREAAIPLTESQKDMVDTLRANNAQWGDIAIKLKISQTAIQNYAKEQDLLAKDGMKALKEGIEGVEQSIEDIGVAFEKDLSESLKAVGADIELVEEKITDLGEAFDKDLVDVLKSVEAEIKGVEQRIQDIPITEGFLESFGEIDLKQEAKRFADNAIGALADAIRTGDWDQFKDSFKKSIAEFMGSAIAAGVNALVPGLGTLLQPLFAAFSELFLGIFDRNRGRDLVEDFAASFGGFDSLHDRLLELGSAGEALWVKLTQGVGRNNPEQAAAVIAEIEEALGGLKTEAELAAARMEGIGVAIDGVNTKATLFAAPFQTIIDKLAELEGKTDAASVKLREGFTASLAAMGEKGQAEFERIGVFAAAAFRGMVLETGDAIGALDRLAPAIGVLKQGVEEFGLTSTGTIDVLIGLFDLVHDQTTGPILQAIQATGQIFAGLQDAGLVTAEIFQTVSDDIGAAFRDLEAKGGDVARAMALSQPVLQRLWEAQQLYGEVTDETTRKILQQAEEQGLVGDHMKDVNQRILDVLIAIADVFGAKIPDSMRNTREAASQTSSQIEQNFRDAGRSIEDNFRNAGRAAASGIEDEFSKIKVPTIYVPVDFEYPDGGPTHQRNPSVPELGSGGIVKRRTLAYIGESGPEAVVPLSQLGSVSPEAGSTTVILQMDGRDVAEVVVPHIPGVARRYITA